MSHEENVAYLIIIGLFVIAVFAYEFFRLYGLYSVPALFGGYYFVSKYGLPNVEYGLLIIFVIFIVGTVIHKDHM